MGIWGAGLYQDDIALDVKDQYEVDEYGYLPQFRVELVATKKERGSGSFDLYR